MSQLIAVNHNTFLKTGAPDNLPRPFGQDIFLFRCRIAGTSYRDLETVEPGLKTGDVFTLRREPENKYDALATAIYAADGSHLGYLPRQQNEVAARLLDAGKLLEARLTAKEWQTGYSNKNWLRLDAEIYLRDL